MRGCRGWCELLRRQAIFARPQQFRCVPELVGTRWYALRSACPRALGPCGHRTAGSRCTPPELKGCVGGWLGEKAIANPLSPAVRPVLAAFPRRFEPSSISFHPTFHTCLQLQYHLLSITMASEQQDEHAPGAEGKQLFTFSKKCERSWTQLGHSY